MADSTINYAWPYPEGGDAVAVASDIEKLAAAADATVKVVEVQADQNQTDLTDLGTRVGAAEGDVSDLQGRVTTTESDITDLQNAQITVTHLGDGVYDIT